MSIKLLVIMGIVWCAGCAGPRYQVSVGGASALLVDTYTGQMWAPIKMGSDGRVVWEPVGPKAPKVLPPGQ